MLDLAGFRARYPEFSSASDGLVGAVLTEAGGLIGDAWGTLAPMAHGLLTAHFLACSPNGQASRLQSDKLETTYGREYEARKRSLAAGRVDLRTP